MRPSYVARLFRWLRLRHCASPDHRSRHVPESRGDLVKRRSRARGDLTTSGIPYVSLGQLHPAVVGETNLNPCGNLRCGNYGVAARSSVRRPHGTRKSRRGAPARGVRGRRTLLGGGGAPQAGVRHEPRPRSREFGPRVRRRPPCVARRSDHDLPGRQGRRRLRRRAPRPVERSPRGRDRAARRPERPPRRPMLRGLAVRPTSRRRTSSR